MINISLLDVIKKYYDEIISNYDYYVHTKTNFHEPPEKFKLFYDVTDKRRSGIVFLYFYAIVDIGSYGNYSCLRFYFSKKIDEDIKLDEINFYDGISSIRGEYVFKLTNEDLSDNYDKLKTFLILSDDTGKLREKYEINN